MHQIRFPIFIPIVIPITILIFIQSQVFRPLVHEEQLEEVFYSISDCPYLLFGFLERGKAFLRVFHAMSVHAFDYVAPGMRILLSVTDSVRTGRL